MSSSGAVSVVLSVTGLGHFPAFLSGNFLDGRIVTEGVCPSPEPDWPGYAGLKLLLWQDLNPASETSRREK
jgi:hypothetical protein